MSVRRGPKLFAKTQLARLRFAAGLTQPEALEEALPFFASCSLKHYRRMEHDPAMVPPALLDRFKKLAARKSRTGVKRK